MALSLLRLTLALLLALDVFLPTFGTASTSGFPLRLYVAHIIMLAVFFTSDKELWRLSLAAIVGVVALTLRDLFLPARPDIIPEELKLAFVLISAFLWVGTLWLAAQYAAHHRRADRIAASQQDQLTGLYNQEYFNKKLAEMLSPTRRRARKVGVMFIDMDHFKQINDQLGHQEGDNMLVAFGDFLLNQTRFFRDTDFPCRWGGDEFAIILSDVSTEEELTAIEQRLQERFDEFMVKYDTTGSLRKLGVGMSAGSMLALPGMDSETVKRIVDERMFTNKGVHHASFDEYSTRHLRTGREGK